MGVVYYLMERLRQVVGPCWDYCVIWKLREDPWLLECVACCCGGSYQKSVEEEEEEVVSSMSCKDVMFPHPRMRFCDLLSQLPPSLPLDGINAEVLISNQPRWLNNAQISDLSTTAEEIMESKVLIPVPGGLVEFYASKMVPEDPSLIDFVLSQSSALSSDLAPYSPSTGLANLDISSSGADATADRIRVCNSALNFLQQFSYLTDTPNNNNNHNNNNKEEEELLLLQAASAAAAGGGEGGPDEEIPNQPQQQQQQLPVLQHEIGRQDSGSDSDPIDDEEDSKYSCSRRKNGKGNQSKNLFAERKRRKKLNERLYKLRSLVPKISKLDRAAILGDAIEYVMELQKLEKDLQTELEHNSDEEEEEGVGSSSLMSTNLMGLGVLNNYEPSNGFYNGKRSLDQNKTTPAAAAAATTSYEKPQQMEVQVEVAQLDGNEFFIKVFGEQKRGGFVRLMEALDSLGLEITTVNVTSCISLVSYVFTVEKKDSETVQAEYLRESLLEMTRNQSGEWAGGGNAQHHLEQQYQQQYYNHHHPFQPFQ